MPRSGFELTTFRSPWRQHYQGVLRANHSTTAEQRSKCRQSRTTVTFEQPLYAKAREVALAAWPHNPCSGFVIRLVGFHLLLPLMCSIGAIMAGSGLEAIWETVCAKNSVVHMMSGRAYARGIRAHLMSQSALATLLLGTYSVEESM